MQNPINIDLGLLCQVVGRRVGVEVIEDPHAHTFATNGKSVIIPKGIAGGELDADIMRGGIAHEAAGHVLHTDFDLLNQWVRKQPPIAHGLQNIIEDPRIELAAIRKYPGCRKMLHKMVETLESRGFFTLPDASSHPSAILGAYLIRALRSELLNQPLSMEVIAPLAEETFGKQKLETMLGLARRGAKGESTADVLRATEAILSILKDEEPPEDEAPDEGDESGEQDGEQSGGGNASQSGDDAGGDDEAAGNCAGKDGKGKAGGNADSNQAPSEQPGANSSSAAQQEAAKKAMDANKSDMGPTDLA